MQLSQKLTLLLVILGSQRKHTLTTIDAENVIIDAEKMILLPKKLQKQIRSGKHIFPIIYH